MDGWNKKPTIKHLNTQPTTRINNYKKTHNNNIYLYIMKKKTFKEWKFMARQQEGEDEEN